MKDSSMIARCFMRYSLLSVVVDDTHDNIMQRLYLMIADDRFKMGIAYTGIVRQEYIAPVRANGSRTSEQLSFS